MAGERDRGSSHDGMTENANPGLAFRHLVAVSAASENAPTSTEVLQLASEQDGTYDGEEKEEQKRRKEEDWAVYTEINKKGAGNTMNRG